MLMNAHCNIIHILEYTHFTVKYIGAQKGSIYENQFQYMNIKFQKKIHLLLESVTCVFQQASANNIYCIIHN